jgi:hypothetical protein
VKQVQRGDPLERVVVVFDNIITCFEIQQWHRLHAFGPFLGPLRCLLFFRRQGRFLLLFSLIFEFFGHGVRSSYLGIGYGPMPPYEIPVRA